MTIIDLHSYNAVFVSISGGKDSQVVLGVIMDAVREQGYQGNVIAVHADTGAEWPQSLSHCRTLCAHYGIPLEIAIPVRPLPDRIEMRCRELQERGKKGGWPDMANRYCTSDCKTAPISKIIRRHFGGRRKTGAKVLSVTGERREESRHRRLLPEFEPHALTCDRDGYRKVWHYRPILDMGVADVWAYIRATRLPHHPAYGMGNERVSCAICVLATESDIRNGARQCPALAERYLRIERETGHAFRHRRPLADILNRVHFEGSSDETIRVIR